MPKKSHKTSFLKQQRRLLEVKLRECLKQQTRALSNLTAIEKSETDLAGIASAILNQEPSFYLANCCAKDIRAICRAILNIDSGRYGICENCEGLIPEKRLGPKAVPWATKCTNCQEAEELRNK